MASMEITRILVGVPIIAFGIWMLVHPERFTVPRDPTSWWDSFPMLPGSFASKGYMRMVGGFFMLIGFVLLSAGIAGLFEDAT
jgi:hypothetical protein